MDHVLRQDEKFFTNEKVHDYQNDQQLLGLMQRNAGKIIIISQSPYLNGLIVWSGDKATEKVIIFIDKNIKINETRIEIYNRDGLQHFANIIF